MHRFNAFMCMDVPFESRDFWKPTSFLIPSLPGLCEDLDAQRTPIAQWLKIHKRQADLIKVVGLRVLSRVVHSMFNDVFPTFLARMADPNAR